MMRALIVSMVLLLAACGSGSSTSAPEATVRQTAAPVVEPPALEQSEPEQAVAVGAMAPAFELPGSDGETHSLSRYAGEHVVLAFFPKAFTGG